MITRIYLTTWTNPVTVTIEMCGLRKLSKIEWGKCLVFLTSITYPQYLFPPIFIIMGKKKSSPAFKYFLLTFISLHEWLVTVID